MTSNTITDKDQGAGGKQLFTETPSGATFVPPGIGEAGLPLTVLPVTVPKVEAILLYCTTLCRCVAAGQRGGAAGALREVRGPAGLQAGPAVRHRQAPP